MTCSCGDPECPQGTLEPTCGDCPDFILGKNSKQRGLCYPFGEGKHMLHYNVSAKDIACQPRLRELKALTEIERMKPQDERRFMVDSKKVNEKWVNGTLDVNDIIDYLQAQVVPMSVYMITYADLEHIADMCYSLYKHSRFERPLGDFLTAIVKDSWSEVCDRADDCNRQWSWMIRVFLVNCAPLNWKEKPHDEDDDKK